MVVLSACDTQRGVKKGGSVMALPWGFMYAGAPSVVASLWKVDDAATSLLMQRFFENLLRQHADSQRPGTKGQPMSKAAALREAKAWLRSLPPDKVMEHLERGGISTTSLKVVTREGAPDFSNPYYWAGFVLIGDPR